MSLHLILHEHSLYIPGIRRSFPPSLQMKRYRMAFFNPSQSKKLSRLGRNLLNCEHSMARQPIKTRRFVFRNCSHCSASALVGLPISLVLFLLKIGDSLFEWEDSKIIDQCLPLRPFYFTRLPIAPTKIKPKKTAFFKCYLHKGSTTNCSPPPFPYQTLNTTFAQVLLRLHPLSDVELFLTQRDTANPSCSSYSGSPPTFTSMDQSYSETHNIQWLDYHVHPHSSRVDTYQLMAVACIPYRAGRIGGEESGHR
jgi:hypothetical protein